MFSFLLPYYIFLTGKVSPGYGEIFGSFVPETIEGKVGNENLKMSRFFCLQNKEVPKCSRRLANNCYSIEPLGRQPTLASIPLNASWISKNFSYSGGSRNNSSLILKSVKNSLVSDNPTGIVCIPHRYGPVSISELFFEIQLWRRVFEKNSLLPWLVVIGLRVGLYTKRLQVQVQSEHIHRLWVQSPVGVCV